jgi:hypothetical protein
VDQGKYNKITFASTGQAAFWSEMGVVLKISTGRDFSCNFCKQERYSQ